jgi:hypothetical protein
MELTRAKFEQLYSVVQQVSQYDSPIKSNLARNYAKLELIAQQIVDERMAIFDEYVALNESGEKKFKEGQEELYTGKDGIPFTAYEYSDEKAFNNAMAELMKQPIEFDVIITSMKRQIKIEKETLSLEEWLDVKYQIPPILISRLLGIILTD